MPRHRMYGFVGPDHIKVQLAAAVRRWRITASADIDAVPLPRDKRSGQLTATYIVDRHLHLWVADLRSEHYCCANGEPVAAAGEIALVYSKDRWSISEINNRSTGYCPEPESWQAAQAALSATGLSVPAGFTETYIFRRCPQCAGINLVKDAWYVCACGADLPKDWNFVPDQ